MLLYHFKIIVIDILEQNIIFLTLKTAVTRNFVNENDRSPSRWGGKFPQYLGSRWGFCVGRRTGNGPRSIVGCNSIVTGPETLVTPQPHLSHTSATPQPHLNHTSATPQSQLFFCLFAVAACATKMYFGTQVM